MNRNLMPILFYAIINRAHPEHAFDTKLFFLYKCLLKHVALLPKIETYNNDNNTIIHSYSFRSRLMAKYWQLLYVFVLITKLMVICGKNHIRTQHRLYISPVILNKQEISHQFSEKDACLKIDAYAGYYN